MARNGLFYSINDPSKWWNVDIIESIARQVREYRDRIGASKIEFIEVEDSTSDDPVNQRYDLWIMVYDGEGGRYAQKCLILKGELIMPVEFHKRHDEFYPRKVAAT